MFKKGLLTALFLLIACVGLIYLYTHTVWYNPFVLSASIKPDATFVFVGDSMTEYLGNFEALQTSLHFYYPTKHFLLLNYGYSGSNILSLPDRFEKDSTHSGRIFQPIDQIPFQYIFIESMANNPLSTYPLEQGLQIQNETLDKVINLITKNHPKTSIIFIATISPNKEHYGEGAVVLTPEKRKEWANERIAYIQNYIKYSKDHNIPVINIFEKSLDSKGDGKLEFLSPVDHIHPSPAGVKFISRQIADFIYNNRLVN